MRSATAPAYPVRTRAALFALAAVAVALALAGTARAASMFYIRGGGNGHGIGMSQYGAYGYALHGRSYRWILAHYYQRTSLGTVAPSRSVRVLLSTGSAAFSGASQAGSKKLHPDVAYAVRPNADGTLTLLRPNGKKAGTFPAPLTLSGPGPLSLAGVGTYRGQLELRPDGNGGVEAVNVIRLDDYVRGVIAWEMPSGWAPEALKVQAVAARTYAITSDAGSGVFDLYADTRSQMYGGVAAETPSTNAAVAATRGQVVSYAGAPVVTYFSASSGGHTENVENVWPGARPEPWLRGVRDPYDGAGGDPYHHWGDQMSLLAAAARLGGLLKGQLIGIHVTRHGTSPRILTAQIIGTKGNTTVTGIQLQHAFGLLTTYAAFTTISTLPGRAPSSPGAAVAPAQSKAVAQLMPLVEQLISATGLHGTVFPPPRSAQVAVQQSTPHGWRTIQRMRLAGGGSYDTALPGPGTYRIVYAGMNGPAVTVG